MSDNMTHSTDRLAFLFHSAQKLPSDQRLSFLEGACGPDVELRRKLVEMLNAQGEHPGFLNRIGANSLELLFPPDEQIGDRFGPYRLVKKIGEGGSGVVYLAEQESPFRRKVALKLLRHGIGSREVMSRFLAEQQALARMNHPNIAHILDGGVEGRGRPYFVMEWIDGVQLDQFCQKHALSTRARVELILETCRAIQHAHDAGVIHRDLKPSNILASTVDGRHIPKIIDFGVAKALARNLSGATIHTGTHQFLGTPSYASPEQLEGKASTVDHRTDIFSLGTILYELVTGTRPFLDRPRSALLMDTGLRLNWKVVPPPSTRLKNLSRTELDLIAAQRSCTRVQLLKHLDGNLDQITMRAIESAPGDRYPTAQDFAGDLANYLDGKPISARKINVAKRFRRRLLRPRWRDMATALAVAVAALVGTIAFIPTGQTTKKVEPVGRVFQVGGWSGSELLLWGGAKNDNPQNSGWRYNPASGRITPMSTDGAPRSRRGAAAVWAGDQLFLWGGTSAKRILKEGFLYEPVADEWKPVSPIGAPDAVVNASLVWTGSRVILWGGERLGNNSHPLSSEGYAYSIKNDVWERLPDAPDFSPRGRHIAVWTGKEMILWSGFDGKAKGGGVAYNPSSQAWRRISEVGAPAPAYFHSAVWTGREMIVFGGCSEEWKSDAAMDDGGRYDPTTDRWRPLSRARAPSPRFRHSAVWTGHEMIIFGGVATGFKVMNDGFAYDPVQDVWRPINSKGAPSKRYAATAEWSGTEMLVWGGASLFNDWANAPTDGGRYDPVKDRWTPIPAPPATP